MTGAWWLTAPLRIGTRLARASRRDVPDLPRPTLSVGSLALGGRAKTPLTAAIARLAIAQGLRPAILSRGYLGRVTDRSEPLVAVGTPWTGASWLAPVAARAAEIGDEPAWLAAVLPGVPVAVHPRRERAAATVLAEHEVDLFLLDGGFQSAVGRDLDLVMLDARADPPFARAAAVREGAEALGRADLLGVLHSTGHELPDHAFAVSREPVAVRELATGRAVAPEGLGPVTLAAGVGDPASVVALAQLLGLTVSDVLAARDHHAPSLRQVAVATGPWLITEKDAVGWATARTPTVPTYVLEQRLQTCDQGRLSSALTRLQSLREDAPATNRSSSSI